MTNDYVKIGQRIVEILASANFSSPPAKSKKEVKKKKCTKGLSCKGTCIDSRKICISELTPKQIQIVNSLRQLLKLGSPIAQQRLEFIKQGQAKKQALKELSASKKIEKQLEKILVENAQKQAEAAVKSAIDILDKAPGRITSADYDKADADLRNQLIDVLGEQQGQRQWDVIRLKYNQSLGDLSNPDPYTFDPKTAGSELLSKDGGFASRQDFFNFFEKTVIDSVEASKYAIETRRGLESKQAAVEKMAQDVLDKYKLL